MSKTQKAKGSCLCGAVKIEANAMNLGIGACHCDMCRKWTGGPLMSVSCGSDVTFSGEEHIGVYDSSQWAERGFCKKCGSGLFYRVKGNREHHIPVGLFDNAENMVFKGQVFIDEKPNYYSFSNETENMTGAETFEKYGDASE